MNINSIGGFSHEELLRNIKTVQPGQREAGAEDLSHMRLNVPIGQQGDKYDYYVNINPLMDSTTLVSFGNASLETAVSQVNVMSFNNDGTVNITSYEAKLQELRENGLSKYVDWNAADKFHLSLISNYSLGYEYSIEDSIKELAASHAVLKNHIERNFKGEEFDKQINELNQLFDKHIEKLASSFSNSIDGFLAGIQGEKEKLHESVKNAFSEMTGNYSAFIRNNKDYAGLKGTEDEWLSGHYRYMSTQLQSVYQSAAPTGTSLYSTKELDEINQFAITANRIVQDIGCTANEEEFGMRLGLMALKADYLADSSNVSQSYKDALMRQVNKSIEYVINGVDEAYQYERENGLPGSKASFAALDRNAIYFMINTIRNTYAQTKDVMAAINEGAKTGGQTFYKKQFDAAYIDMSRYGYGSGYFWDRMYQPQTTGGYTHSSIMEQIANSFNDLFGKDFSCKMNLCV